MKLLITGGAGFIASNFIRWLLNNIKKIEVVNIDRITFNTQYDIINSLKSSRHKFIKMDILSSEINELAKEKFDYIFHFAAETHVDRSNIKPKDFYRVNVMGTLFLLEAFIKNPPKKFIYVSTDEVYGPVSSPVKEDAPLRPTSPYASSKAAADLLSQSYYKTYGFPIVITRSSNAYGPWQFPEKLIPFFITQALEEKPLYLYGEGNNMREWIYVDDLSYAFFIIMKKGNPGEIYNIKGESMHKNIEVTKLILKILNKPMSLIEYVKDRLSHDKAYILDGSKLTKLGFKHNFKFVEGLKKTIDWYIKNELFWKKAKSHPYFADFFNKYYSVLK
ncbi:MAG: dTDP-glucose 4,6-dehydratase [bacterium]|nr:dTDP-glucose 4,6-dehydratase [bacterium]